MAGGNRARFIPSQTLPTALSASSNAANTPNHSSDASFSSTLTSTSSSELDTTTSSLAVSLIPFSKQTSAIDASNSPRPASDCSDDEIIAQRTRTTETETLYKAKKERSGKLNVSGLLKRKDSGAKNAVPVAQSANIQEIFDDEQLDARSPRQHSSQKLFAKTNSHSASTSASVMFAPPSNQLAAQRTSSSRQLLRLEASMQDALQRSHSPIRSDSYNSHIFTRSSKDEKIKGLTTAFNRKHSTASRATPPRYTSPVQNISQAENRSLSPQLGLEDGFSESVNSMEMQDQSDRKHEGQAFGTKRGMDEFEEPHKMVEHHGGTMKESLSHREPHEKRGEKRGSGSDVEDVYANHAGKRARTENYDESVHDVNSRMSISPTPNRGMDGHNLPSNFGELDAQAQFSVRGPQIKFFLGQDVDEYISAHMDRYEAAKKRWAECSREEWEKGADEAPTPMIELVEKFTEVLDFVKDHVKRKVTLFASLHAKIDQHQKERAQTAEMLKQAKNKLVAKTGVVVDEGESPQRS